MYCKKCGLPLDEGTKFCPSCGEPVKEEKIEVTIEEPKEESSKQKENDFSKKATDAFNSFNDTEDTTDSFDPTDIAENKAISVLSYFGILFLIPLLARQNSRFARFHVNQGIVLFLFDSIAGVAGSVVSAILVFIPAIGGILSGLVSTCISVAIFVLVILGIVNAATGKAKRLPVIGKFDLLK